MYLNKERFLLAVLLIASAGLAFAGVDSGTGAPQDTGILFKVIDWVYVWLTF